MRVLPGYIGVQMRPAHWRGPNRDAWFIQIGTRSPWSHAAIAISEVKAGRVHVIEAAGGGVRKRWINPTNGEWMWFDFNMSRQQAWRVVHEAYRNMGLPYDYMDIAKFVLRFWTNKIPRRTRPDYADDKVICSELVAWCLYRAGVDPWPDRAFGAVSPGDIALEGMRRRMDE